MSCRIDHLVIAGGDLDQLVEWFTQASGITPTPGGHHERLGTRNALVSLGDPSLGFAPYLELIAPDPAQPPPSGLRPFGIDGLGPNDVKLASFCVGTNDIEATMARLAESEAVPGPISEMSRLCPDGDLLEWRVAFPISDRQQGVIPFLIEWGPDTPHPAAGLAPGCTLSGITLQHPEPDFVSSAIEHLNLTADSAELIEVVSGQPAIISATVETPQGTLVL